MSKPEDPISSAADDLKTLIEAHEEMRSSKRYEDAEAHLLESVVALRTLSREGMFNAARRELRYLLDGSARAGLRHGAALELAGLLARSGE